MTWTNKDGLVVRFGAERASSADSGQVAGIKEYIVLDLPDATALPLVGAIVAPAEDSPRIPASSVITNAWMVATTDFTSGGSATLDIGLIDAAGAYVANAGAAGQLVDADAWPVFTYVAAVYTAGAGKLIVEYIRVA